MESATSASLLVRLRDVGNEDAWDDFYRLYSPLILSFACRRGCTPDDAADVLQETMVRLLRTFPGFSYEPALGSFRSFLLKVVDARIKDAFRRKAARERLSQRVEGGAIPLTEEPDEKPDPGAEWDRLWDTNLLRRALEQVKNRVQPTTFESFQLYVVEGVAISEVQARTGLPPNVIYQHRNRVMKLLRKHVEALKSELGE
ncbi:MAG: sigma-70 family RNA polymerase sigma factor [Lentisphaerae bacterium]|jgi:RNA polymerase sigma factor (sigma-70 family)|nr:sigma-70 family RNA polymerase sigma factor [Lentisphaerota bacterium]MBT4814506.1 sigma-70 family RNA polymerase sigma factor [Lentisphaerota bacterium]MBT5605209.1 sigma-70 family RNA polymerase sigma factor [Lentisphaerota bacterium]MBT7054339.1 sigma-70 family RNA polymerase sigma factor [Lentisphaerota bacterium]MBT7844877.1 sigma-70 family RNA polymerase sigma factor [Lentisphaerota bacterium]